MGALSQRLLSPLNAWRQSISNRASTWAFKRVGQETSPIRLHRRRVYILPTPLGLVYAAMIFTMLLAGLNYANNLALILTFVLAASGWVAMHECNRNLVDLTIEVETAAPVFAGQPLKLAYQISDTAQRARYDLLLSVDANLALATSVASRGVSRVVLELPTVARGILRIARVKVETRYPLGLCRAWSWLYVMQECVVYPTPSDKAQAGQAQSALQGQAQAIESPGDEDWRGLKTYAKGDARRRIAWKAYARSGLLLTKELNRTADAPQIFSWHQVQGPGAEQRLSQLTRLIIKAARRDQTYALHLPQLQIPLGRGPGHRHDCLRALALFSPATADS